MATKPRVNIPRNPSLQIDLGSKIYKKHLTLAAASPLNALQAHTWAQNGPQVALALAQHQLAEDLSRQAEEAYRKRDLLLVEIDESVKSSRDLLLGVYRDNPKILGEWGFEVDDSVCTAKPKAV